MAKVPFVVVLTFKNWYDLTYQRDRPGDVPSFVEIGEAVVAIDDATRL